MLNQPQTPASRTMRDTLRAAVDASALSRQDIALRAGISRRALYSLVEGTADPRLSTLEALAHVLDLDLFVAPRAVNTLQLSSPAHDQRSEHSRVRRLLETPATYPV